MYLQENTQGPSLRDRVVTRELVDVNYIFQVIYTHKFSSQLLCNKTKKDFVFEINRRWWRQVNIEKNWNIFLKVIFYRTFNFCETSKDSDSSDETEEEFFPDKIRKR